MEIAHVPVLLEQTLHYLAPRSRHELMIDTTMGEGGHSHAFLSRFPDLSIIGIDADPVIQDIAKERLAEFGNRVQFYHGWSQDFFAAYPKNMNRPNTILSDLGISIFHYEKSGRGFSFTSDEKLDMRIDPDMGIPAAELLAQMSEKEIADTLYRNAGERYSLRIAKVIVQERRRSAVSTASTLSELVKKAVPAVYRHGPIHPATKTFMALRIAVNGELDKLPGLLEGALGTLEPGGRLGVISFHSLEDRIVKNFFRMKSRACTCPPNFAECKCSGKRFIKILTGKGVTAETKEIKQNLPSRSARLRVAEKLLG